MERLYTCLVRVWEGKEPSTRKVFNVVAKDEGEARRKVQKHMMEKTADGEWSLDHNIHDTGLDILR